MLQTKNLPLLLAASTLLWYCQPKKNDPTPTKVEQEVITDFYVELKDTTTTPVTIVTAKLIDPDGDGGTPASITGVTLAANKTYKLEQMLYDKSKSTPDTITHEIEEKSDVHLFVFQPSAGLALTVSGLNLDSKSQALGLKATLKTGAAGSGTLKVTLRHYDSATEKTAGLTDASKGETDVEASFPITIN